MMNGNLISSSTGKNIIRCNLCGRQILEAPPLNIPPAGELPKEAAKVQGILQKHLKQFHEREVMQAVAIAQGFLPFLIWNAFDHQDESVPPMIEAIRAPLFAMVRKNTLSDDALLSVVASFGLDPDDAAKVLAGMKSVRDVCCELGQFVPKPAEQPRIHKVGP